MATYYESAYKQLLMGVSQQDPKDRLDGQLSEQINMTSDPVYGLRRRSPLRYEGIINTYWDLDKVAVLNVHPDGELMFVLVNSIDGAVSIVNKRGEFKWGVNSDYLKASAAAAIKFAILNDKIYIANVEKAPREVNDGASGSYPDPRTRGYWTVQAAAFSTKYICSVTFQDDLSTIYAEYNTPGNDGSALAIQQTTLSYIANDFVKKFNGQAGLTATASGNTLCIKSDGRPISVTTSNPRALSKGSNNAKIRTIEDLPSYLDEVFMDNFIMEVGTGTKSTYYRYDYRQKVWLEDAKWGTGKKPTNMPLCLTMQSTDKWTLEEPRYSRRSAGDERTNPTLKFIENGITGIGVFQGRLIFLAGEYVCMSATNQPEQWYRTTVDSLDPSDPIEAAGSDSTASPYVCTALFNKDLIIYGNDVQAIVPGTQPVTPSNVVIGVMSRYKCTLLASPATTGKSQYVGASRGDGYAAVWEVVPSDFVSSQITANDVTSHIPSYIRGLVRLITASTTSSIVAVGTTDSPNTLLIEEYLWDGSEKKQAAWHKWVFAKDVLHAVFEQDTMYMLVRDSDALGTHICSLDLRRGARGASITVPRLDYHKTFVVNSDGNITADLNYFKLIESNPYGFKITGVGHNNIGISIEVISTADQIVTAKAKGASPGDEVVIGLPYESSFTLSPPKILDSNGVAVTMYKSTLQEYHINWAYTGGFKYRFSDKFRTIHEADVKPAYSKGDPDKEGWLPLSSVATRLPVRLDMNTINAKFSTRDVYDLCPTLVEYGYRYNQVRGRRV